MIGVVCLVVCFLLGGGFFIYDWYNEQITLQHEKAYREVKDEQERKQLAEAESIEDYLALAYKGNEKAYYPLAKLYYENGNLVEAGKWVGHVSSYGDLQNFNNAGKLLLKIVEAKDSIVHQQEDWDTIFKLADDGFYTANLVLAKHCLETGDYDNAHKYAQRVYKIGFVGDKEEACKILLNLKKLGFYRDKRKERNWVDSILNDIKMRNNINIVE